MTDKLKIVVYQKLCQDLNNCDIIKSYDGDLWYFDKNTKYWFLQYNSNEKSLYWNYTFFNHYCDLFDIPLNKIEFSLYEWLNNNTPSDLRVLLPNSYESMIFTITMSERRSRIDSVLSS